LALTPDDIDALAASRATSPRKSISSLAGRAEAAAPPRRTSTNGSSAEQLAATDPLTGLANRRGCESIAGEICGPSASASRPAASCRHRSVQAGQRLRWATGRGPGAREISAMLRQSVRVDDIVARWGGEEFSDPARPISKLRASWLSIRLGVQKPLTSTVTISPAPRVRFRLRLRSDT
jgi:GGDEF domain-containing protein